MKNLDIRKFSAKWIPKCLNADQKRQTCRSSEQHLEFFFCQRDQNDFLSRLVTMEETWLYHYDAETKQQSMDWRHSGSSRPESSECKNSVKKFSPRFFKIKMAFSWWIIFKRAKVSTRLCWCNWRTFWRKSVAGISPRWHSCSTIPRLTGHFQSRRNWPTWASSVLISHPNLRFWPRRTTTCPMDCRKQ